jgi:RimJ/RimL family protein N-acetyltransferase
MSSDSKYAAAGTVSIPTLESERLRLREYRTDDFDDFAAFMADGERSKYIGGPADRYGAWRLMAIEIGHWTMRGYGMWIVEEKRTGAFIGSCGLWNPEGWPEPEVGYWVVREQEGKGYATEAARRVRDYAFEDLGWSTLISCIDPANEPSKQVVARLGARYEKTVDLPVGPVEIYRHPSPDSLRPDVGGL